MDEVKKMFGDDVLEVSIKHIAGRKKCPKCGKRPEIAYWGTGKMIIQCRQCKGESFESPIKASELQITPAILRALDMWNEGKKGITVKRKYVWDGNILRMGN